MFSLKTIISAYTFYEESKQKLLLLLFSLSNQKMVFTLGIIGKL